LAASSQRHHILARKEHPMNRPTFLSLAASRPGARGGPARQIRAGGRALAAEMLAPGLGGWLLTAAGPAGAASQVTLPFTGLSYVTGVAVDAAGSVCIADYGNRVVELPAMTNTATTLSSSAKARAALRRAARPADDPVLRSALALF
jgi:hypothetical protein